MKKFAEEHGLSSGHVGRIVKGKWHSIGGWHRPGETPPSVQQEKDRAILREYRAGLRRPENKHSGKPRGGYPATRRPHNSPFSLMFEGVVYNGTNTAKFAREHGLHPGNLNSVVLGTRHAYKGWTLPDNPKRVYRLVSPEGAVYVFTNIRAFSREVRLKHRCVNRVVLGQRVTHKGWRLAPTNATLDASP